MTKRQRHQREYIYGLNPVAETLKGKREIARLLVREERRNEQRVAALVDTAQRLRIAVESTDQRRLDSLSDGGNHQGVVLEVGPFQYTDLEQMIQEAVGRPILVLDRIQDPQNLATLVRTAAAVDCAGLVIQTDRSAMITPAVVRSSAGLVEQLHVVRENNTRRTLDTLKESGYWATALELTDESQNLFTADIPEPVALVVGSEGRGVSANVIKACDLVVSLPMPGPVESLNVAVAGSVGLFEILRRRQQRD
ncbi:MAG: 23S rRNA (guanosine(2251)-2'-O)-methyltransferase RlmB [Thermomicrobiaceae bacterium]